MDLDTTYQLSKLTSCVTWASVLISPTPRQLLRKRELRMFLLEGLMMRRAEYLAQR